MDDAINEMMEIGKWMVAMVGGCCIFGVLVVVIGTGMDPWCLPSRYAFN